MFQSTTQIGDKIINLRQQMSDVERQKQRLESDVIKNYLEMSDSERKNIVTALRDEIRLDKELLAIMEDNIHG